MKKYIIGIVSIVTLCISGYTFADLAGYTIDSYDVSMNLHSDGSMDVKEIIDVNFSEQRHGIYREIPIKDTVGDYIHIRNLDVIGDPVASNTIEGDQYVLKIGDADSYVYGPKEYTITYTVENAIKAYASGSSTRTGAWQELYRNIIGTNRATTINKPTFSITLPSSYTFGTGEIFMVRGAAGQNNKTNTQIEQTTGTTIEGSLQKQLQPNEGVTVGLQFPADYFVADSSYNNLFTQEPTEDFGSTVGNGIQGIGNKIGNIISEAFPFVIWVIIILLSSLFGSKSRGSITGRKPAWKSDKAVAPYYLPPRDITPSEAFWFWYNAQNPQIFVALLYYRATQGRVHISLVEGRKYLFGIKGENTYTISEVIENPKDSTELDKDLLQAFFGQRDNNKDQVQLDQNSYSKMAKVLSALQAYADLDQKRYQKIGSIFTRKYQLTSQGQTLFEQMRGYKEYLEKVERPVIEQELKTNPDFLNTILPWAVLFGVETRLLKVCEDMLQDVQWYDSYNGRGLNAYAFASMTNNIKSSVIAPRSSGGSSGSGFSSSGGGFSGGGGGGGGGGSW